MSPTKRARSRLPILFAASLLPAAPLADGQVSLAGVGAIFTATEPQVLYVGSTTEPREGVIVIRDAETFREAVAPLSPDFGGSLPDLRKRSILRVIGPDFGTRCGSAELAEVSTRMMNATVTLRVAEPAEGCACTTAERPRSAWLVAVGRAVRRAIVEIQRSEIPCGSARSGGTGAGPAMIFEGSWDGDPGAMIVADAERFADVARQLGVKGRAPEVDFSSERVVVVTGRPRANGCRRTLALATDLATQEEFVVTLQEVYAPPGQVCTQLFSLPRVFAYRVPASVTLARVVTKESR
jgi:hypothetical protein